MEKIIIKTANPDMLGSLVKGIIRRELDDVEGGIELTRARLHSFEMRYNITTTEFLHRFTRDNLGETLDFIEWDGEVKTLELLEEKKALFEEAKVD